MHETLCQIIEAEADRFNEPLAEKLRAAAWIAVDEFPHVTSSQFADAAAACGFHRQGAINRFNEAMKNLAHAG